MTSSFARFLAVIAGCAVLICADPAAQAADNDRMAGSVPVSKPSDTPVHSAAPPPAGNNDSRPQTKTTAEKPAKEKTSTEQPEKKSTPAAAATESSQDNTDIPKAPEKRTAGARTSNLALADIESAGTLASPAKGSLGVDLWDGSDRLLLMWLIPRLPDAPEHRTMNILLRRALLTAADASLMDNRGGADKNQDLLTLRIEKLTGMGAFHDAVELYTSIPGDPHHDRLAMAGIMAMFYDGQPSLACLEANALHEKFGKSSPQWQDVYDVCAYLLAKMGGQDRALFDPSAERPDSRILDKVVKDEKFRYNLKSARDFDALSPLEKTILVGDSRIDYGPARRIDAGDFSSASLSLLLRDRKVPDDFRLRLLVSAVERGTKTGRDIADFYLKVTDAAAKNGDQESFSGWQKIAYFYRKARDTRRVVPKADITADYAAVAGLASEYGIMALSPFAPFLNDSSPEILGGIETYNALIIMIKSWIQPPKSWVSHWNEHRGTSTEDTLLAAALAVIPAFSTEKSKIIAASADALTSGKRLTETRALLIKILDKNLDNGGKLHNYEPEDAYDKNNALTDFSSYVMPYIGLIDTLGTAEKNRRLGEVVLLSSLALQDPSSGAPDGDTVRKVIGALETVGLTKEARELTQDVILGLSR